MYQLSTSNLQIAVDFQAGYISSLKIKGVERLVARLPLFRICLRKEDGTQSVISAFDAHQCTETCNGAYYEGFQNSEANISLPKMRVRVYLTSEKDELSWRIAVDQTDLTYLTEWVEIPLISLPKLLENNECGDGGSILFPYNEGVLVSNSNYRRHKPAQYPSDARSAVFPNMVCSQMLAYLWDDVGLYVGAHDENRGVKVIDFYEENDAITIQLRLYCGINYGESYESDFPIVWAVTDGHWESAAERYRQWFESALPSGVKKIMENPTIPSWYEDSPLIVSYPVRGIHDMDEMSPNALYPYTNALPLIKDIQNKTDSRIMVLLMHWEGTAPWAPPHVWPPYGGVENFNEFMSALHKDKNLLGVYCSGFGYTIQSNLISDYNMQAEYDQKKLERGMCAGPDNKVSISKICTGQRSGYDVCPASEVGRKLLDEAYQPLFDSDLDYVQILDQNHGGGQYFCYSKNHGHPPVPGTWMTKNMQKMLSDWNQKSKGALFGCESAAAEPFIGNLQFSDNRFEINYPFGRSVPMYAYIYHEYVRNFMGNQVGSPFVLDPDSLLYRIAYSFSAGDAMTIVLTPDGDVNSYWGNRDFSNLPEKEKVLGLIKNLTAFYRKEAKPYLFAGRMIASPQVDCKTVSYTIEKYGNVYDRILPSILSSAWEAPDGSRALILVNPLDTDQHCTVDQKEYTVLAQNARLIPIK